MYRKQLFIKNHKLLIMALLSILVMSIFSMNFAILFVYGESMEPNIHDGSMLFGKKTFKHFDRFDVVACLDDTSMSVIKRIIGLPGETIEYKDNKLYVNGEFVEDTYGVGNTNDFIVQLDDNNYYCLGDNRENSRDSRSFGQISKRNIIAEVVN